MAEPPELWLFVLSNLLVLLLGGVLTALSFRAYLRSGRRQVAVVGFGVITLSGVIDAIYELGIRGSYELSGRELLVLHTVEGVVLAVGLAALFYSIKQN